MSNRTNGSVVRQFEQAFAQYVGARYAIACCNGTVTLHTALVALGVKPWDWVAVPPLTMASTTLAVLHAGAVPLYVDIDPQTWLMDSGDGQAARWWMPVALYGLTDLSWSAAADLDRGTVMDGAQALTRADTDFTSISFQASKILSAGEGGMLVTDDAELADRAVRFSRLGYDPGRPVDDLKTPDVYRHWTAGYNYRLSDLQAQRLLLQLSRADTIVAARRYSARCYREAIAGCSWLTPQYVPEGWPHSYWAFAVACDSRERADALQQAIVDAGGERCYRAWRVTYQEPAFRYLAPDGTCPVAEDLQPRLLQLQTNHDFTRAEQAAECLHRALAMVTVTA
jgi:perosamine synthetase